MRLLIMWETLGCPILVCCASTFLQSIGYELGSDVPFRVIPFVLLMSAYVHAFWSTETPLGPTTSQPGGTGAPQLGISNLKFFLFDLFSCSSKKESPTGHFMYTFFPLFFFFLVEIPISTSLSSQFSYHPSYLSSMMPTSSLLKSSLEA